jgi:hypothetical protein
MACSRPNHRPALHRWRRAPRSAGIAASLPQLGTAACALVALVATACQREPSRLDRAAAEPAGDRIPLAGNPIVLDGAWHEPAWNSRALRGVLADERGAPARPYSEIRLLHDASTLYLGLYAADEDIGSNDRWQLILGELAFEVDPAAHATYAGARAAVDVDGTLDKHDDYDEEWVLEVAVPIASVGAAPVAVDARRCDTPKHGTERCGQWRARVGLE